MSLLVISRNSKIRIQRDCSYRVKAYQFKEASDAIRQQFGENKRLRFQAKLSENKKVVDTDFVHLHNHTQFSVLQSTISIPC
jgi:DNA polymerase-3 subunit alpha